jgi:4-diphosphocytidyl-2-C-methyl-D-erythritol kinase
MPATVTERARAKVNLALHVLGRRPDGYHDLHSTVAFAEIADRLTLEEADRFELAVSGPFAQHVPQGDDNLAVKAAVALSRAFGRALPPVRIALEMNLPVASGLGGGSADAAAVLRGLTRLLAIDCRLEALHEIAMALGADVPVCLRSCASTIRGIGEIVEPIGAFRPRHVLLVNPGVTLRTAAVFREFEPASGGAAPNPCRNDLTAAAVRLAPIIGDVLGELKRHPGVEQARMSGSGATCFGLFSSSHAAEEACEHIAGIHPDWWCRATVLG